MKSNKNNTLAVSIDEKPKPRHIWSTYYSKSSCHIVTDPSDCTPSSHLDRLSVAEQEPLVKWSPAPSLDLIIDSLYLTASA